MNIRAACQHVRLYIIFTADQTHSLIRFCHAPVLSISFPFCCVCQLLIYLPIEPRNQIHDQNFRMLHAIRQYRQHNTWIPSSLYRQLYYQPHICHAFMFFSSQDVWPRCCLELRLDSVAVLSVGWVLHFGRHVWVRVAGSSYINCRFCTSCNLAFCIWQSSVIWVLSAFLCIIVSTCSTNSLKL